MVTLLEAGKGKRKSGGSLRREVGAGKEEKGKRDGKVREGIECERGGVQLTIASSRKQKT